MRILQAAYRLFRQRGFTRVNVDEIAAAADVTKRTLYSHFESKDALLAEVLRAQHEQAFTLSHRSKICLLMSVELVRTTLCHRIVG